MQFFSFSQNPKSLVTHSQKISILFLLLATACPENTQSHNAVTENPSTLLQETSCKSPYKNLQFFDDTVLLPEPASTVFGAGLIIQRDAENNGDSKNIKVFPTGAMMVVGDSLYPQVFKQNLHDSIYDIRCGTINGTWKTDEIILDDVAKNAGVSVSIDGEILSVDVSRVTELFDTTVHIRGTYQANAEHEACINPSEQPDGDILAIDIPFSLGIRRPNRSEIVWQAACIGDNENLDVVTEVTVQSGARWSVILAGIYQDDEQIFPSTISGSILSAYDVTTENVDLFFVNTPDETSQNPVLSLQNLLAVLHPEQEEAGEEGRVVLKSRLDQRETMIHVVPASRITSVDAKIGLLGFGGGGAVFEDGDQFTGFARTGDHVAAIFGHVYVDGKVLCSEANPFDWIMTTDTPDTCPIQHEICAASIGEPFAFGNPSIESGHVVKDGPCHTRITAPAFSSGNGISHEVTVTLSNTESLLEL